MEKPRTEKAILQIDQKMSQRIYDELWERLIALRQTVVRARDYAEMIGLPQPGQQTGLLQTVMELLIGFTEAQQRIVRFNKARQKQQTTLPPSTDNLEKLDQELNQPHERLPTPETEQIDPIAGEAQSQRIDVTRTE